MECHSANSGVSHPDLFQLGKFTLASGRSSFWKIDCDSLTADEIACLARLVLDRVPPFGRVVGVPRGGVRLAAALEAHCRDHCARVLLVDDVYMTGESMRNEREHICRNYRVRNEQVVGFVLFAREVVTDDWITPLFQITPATYG